MAEEILDKNVNTVEVDEPEIDGEIKDIEDNTQVEHAYGADDIQILEGSRPTFARYQRASRFGGADRAGVFACTPVWL